MEGYVSFGACKEVVHAEYFISLGEQLIAQMRADEAATSCNENLFDAVVCSHQQGLLILDTNR